MIEVLVAALVLVLGLGTMFVAFGGPQRLSLSALRVNEAASIAQSDIESIVGRPYADIQLASNPVHMSDPTPNNPADPRYFVGPDTETIPQNGFKILDSYHSASSSPADVTSSSVSTNGVEPFVPASVTNSLPATSATPSGGPAGTIYRFVTYRSELCSPTINTTNTTTNPLGIISELVQPIVTFLFGKIQHLATNTCAMHNIEKRVTVAVVLTAAGNGSGPFKPVYASTLIPDPSYGAAQVVGIKSCGTGLLSVLCTLLGNLLGL